MSKTTMSQSGMILYKSFKSLRTVMEFRILNKTATRLTIRSKLKQLPATSEFNSRLKTPFLITSVKKIRLSTISYL